MRRAFLALGLFAVVGGCATAAEPPTVSRSLATASSDRGLFLVLRSCAGCHAVGPLGESPTVAAPTFGELRLRYNPLSLERRLRDISKNGHMEMPPVRLADDEIEDIVAYIETAAIPPGGPPLIPLKAPGRRDG